MSLTRHIRRTTGAESIATRQSLLLRLKNREDQTSWQDFFDTYWRLIYNMAIQAGLSDTEAQDVVQTTVISVANKIDGFTYTPGVCSFKTWMLRVTRWRILDQLEKRQRAERIYHSGADTGTDTIAKVADPARSNLEALWDEEWAKNLFTAALERVKQRVSPEQFQMFDLNVLEEWPVARVSRALGVSAARVHLAKHRISRLIKKEIQKLERSS